MSNNTWTTKADQKKWNERKMVEHALMIIQVYPGMLLPNSYGNLQDRLINRRTPPVPAPRRQTCCASDK